MQLPLAKIDEVAFTVDVLIVGIHWGIEYEATARTKFRNSLIKWWITAWILFGVTIRHVVQNSEVYNGAPIYYPWELCFDQYWSKATQQGLVVALKIQDGN